MDNIHILCISDIHFDRSEPENQGLVLNEFFKDISERMNPYDMSLRYCIIAGDLVNIGNTKQIYDKFYDSFIKRIIKVIPIEHIICTPGNHDLNRNEIIKTPDDHAELISFKNKSETEFNEKVTSKDSIVRRKFKAYDDFCNEHMHILNYNLFGFYNNLLSEISVYCLNSALLSNGGLDKSAEGKDKYLKDEGLLKIETSGLYDWATNNNGRQKILVLHHPTYHLNEYIRRELSNIIDKHVDIVITGHIHEPDMKQYIGVKESNTFYCSCPQLFSDKHDQNGYSILHFKGPELNTIEYRKWSVIKEVFTAGSDFSGTDSGIISFDVKKLTHNDFIRESLQGQLSSSLSLYLYTPSWVDRTMSNLSPQNRRDGTDEKLYDHLDILNSQDNIQIIGGPQFGLTTLARKLALDAWCVNKEHWMYFNTKEPNVAKLHQTVNDFTANHHITKTEIAAVIFDGCKMSSKNLTKVIEKSKELMPNARLIMLNDEFDDTIINGVNTEDTPWDFQTLYLRELGRKAIRSLVKEFISKQGFDRDPEDKLLQRLIMDIMDLNVHRTPVNCIQLLMSFKQNYDSRPVNRSKVLSSLIQFFFMKPDSFFYNESIDEDDCCIIMGALCGFLFEGENFKQYFTDADFKKAMEKLDGRYASSQLTNLFHSMIDAQIIIQHYNYYTFRFNYWVYYFAAYQMHISDEFYSLMMEKQCIYMPEIIEYYTGINPKCKSLVERIVDELTSISKSVETGLGISIGNPYQHLKWGPNKILEEKTTEQLESDIMASRLPDEIKDAVLDSQVDSARPFIQAIDQVFDKYQVKNMMSLARSGSRALRNCNHLSEDERKKLYDAIMQSWNSLLHVLVLLTPALAKKGFGGYGGAGFKLNGNFPDEPEKRIIPIITNIPFNIIEWYKNDVFSDKRFSIYKDAILNNKNPILRHISALLVLKCRPTGWKEITNNYIGTLPKNSYFLGDVFHNLCHCYSIDTMSTPDLGSTKRLIELCIRTHGKSTVDIPKREISDR